jgi:hypothetical protein
MRRRMTHLFVGVEAGIGLESRRWMLEENEFQASMTSIDTSIDNLKRKLHFRHSKL